MGEIINLKWENQNQKNIMTTRIDFLRRKNLGKNKLSKYKALFNIFHDIIHIPLEESDRILSDLNFTKVSNQIIEDTASIEDTILIKLYENIDNTDNKAYVFTDDFIYCGLFLINTKDILRKSLEIVKKEENNTLFILDTYKRFFIRINYYDYLHKEFPSMYDINISEDSPR